MFKRRDIPPVLLLLLLIILVMLTLSQILVVHNGRYGRNVHNMRKLQLELREMDINLHSLMMQNVPSIELNRRLLQNEINAGRIAAIIAQASRTQQHTLPGRARVRGRGAGRGQGRGMGAAEAEARWGGAVSSSVQDHRDVDQQQQQEYETKQHQVQEIAAARTIRTKGSSTITNVTASRTNTTSNPSLNSSSRNTSQTFKTDTGQRRGPLSQTTIVNSKSLTNSPLLSSQSLLPLSPVQSPQSHTVPARHHTSLSTSSNTSTSTNTSTSPSSPHKDVVVPQSDTSSLEASKGSHFRSKVLPTSGGHLQGPGGASPSRPPPVVHQGGGGGDYGVGMISRTSLSNSNDSTYTGRYGVIHVPRAKGKKKERINYCPSIPPNLKGRVFVNFEHRHNFTEGEIVRHNSYIKPGGMWRPTACVARHRVAIIVPYRDRWEHLMILLSHLHPILERQQLDYRIFVVEQWGKDTFNKARIMNIAFVEALKQNNFQCFVFHDVDLVPEDDRNMYSCPTQPRHMSVAIDEMGYKLAYQELVGGVLNMRTEHFQRVNGYSNLYWGWGAEDDDMAYRIMHVGLKITRPPEGVARYKMVKHTKRKPADWRKRAKLLYTGTRRFQFDGLNSLQYRVVHIKKLPLFSHILVDIGKPPRGF